MKLRQDEQFRSERVRFNLRFNCEECVLFDSVRDLCAHGYPTAEHRRDRYRDSEADVVFCKEFELT